MSRRILVTGAAGFIGMHVCQRLLETGDHVTGLDSLNDYYDVSLKMARLSRLGSSTGFTFVKGGLEDAQLLERLFAANSFDVVINLAAQAGVRYSLKNPYAYLDSNLAGFLNVLEGCRHSRVGHLVFASSSSVYGANTMVPFSVHHNTDHPLSLYAATKKANELMAHSYSAMYGLPVTGIRLFTVYGPWGRPDMAYYSFTKSILEGRPIEVFNSGMMKRDFTYIDDVVEGVVRIAERAPIPSVGWDSENPDPASSASPWKLYNLGNNRPVELLYLIETLEKRIGKTAVKTFMPMQPGDVTLTFADIDDLVNDTGFRPSVSIEEGIGRFVDWYRKYHE